jgi:hypothetical protein
MHKEYDPEHPSDRGPHVDRVGIVAVDTDYQPSDDDDAPPAPLAHHASRRPISDQGVLP